MAKAGAHGGTDRERRRDLASGRDRSDGGAVGVGGGETVAPGDERTPNEVRRHRNRTRLREPRVRVWIATGHTDMRRGMQGLALQVQEQLKRDPHGGDLYLFRGRRGDLAKILWHDGVGLSLYAKRLDRGKFIWPSAKEGVVSISPAQMAYMLEGIDWRNPQLTWRPKSAG
jgi:transposase